MLGVAECSFSLSHARSEGAAEDNLPADVIEEGTQIIEELLRSWATSSHGGDSEDVEMTDDSETPERQVEELKRCVERFRSRIEGNAWARNVLASL